MSQKKEKYDPKFDEFIAWIKREIKRSGLTHKQIAQGHCSRSLITGTLNKYNNPAQEFLLAVADALKIPVDVMFAKAGLAGDYEAELKEAEPLHQAIARLPGDKRAIITEFVEYLAQKEGKKEKEDDQDLIERADNLTQDDRAKIIRAADHLKRKQKPDNPKENQTPLDLTIIQSLLL